MISFFIIFYLLLTLGIGFWASKRIKNSGDFMLAGKSLSAILVGVTLFATWFGSSQIMGNPSHFIKNGFISYVTLILSGGICLFIVGQFFARKLYRMNIVTISDFFRIRYNKKLELASSVIMVFSYPHWIAAQFVALAYLFNSVMGIPIHYGIIIGAAIVVFYTYIGGMWAVAYTDMVQSVMILLGLFIVLFEVLNQTGGLGPIFSNQPSEFFNFYPSGGFDAWAEYIALLLTFVIGPMPVQEIYQRVFSAKNENVARNGLFLGAILMIIIPSIPLIIGLGGVHLYPELINNENNQDIIPSLVNMMTSPPVQILFYGAIISAILSTSSGAMLAPATVVAENLIKPYATNLSDSRLLLYTRLSVILVAGISCYFAFDDSDIVGLVAASLSLILVCLFVPFTFGLLWKKASVTGAWAAISIGGLSWFFCYMYETRIDPIIYGTAISSLSMIIGSTLYPGKIHSKKKINT